MEFLGTKGTWDYTKCQISNTINITSDGGLTSIGNIYTTTFCGEYFNEETEANAELIAEAGNIRQEIPFSLTELKRQRDEMLEMLKELSLVLKSIEGHDETVKEVNQLIKEATNLNK